MWEEIIETASRRWGVPVQWVAGVVGAESSFLPASKTWEAAVEEYSWGPMQILGSTAREMGFTGALEGLSEPGESIEYGTKYLASLIRRYGLDFDAVISAYNRGHADPVGGRAYIERVRGWIDRLYPAELAETAVEVEYGMISMLLLYDCLKSLKSSVASGFSKL